MYLKRIKEQNYEKAHANCKTCFFCYKDKETKMLLCCKKNQKNCIPNNKRKTYYSYKLTIEKF